MAACGRQIFTIKREKTARAAPQARLGFRFVTLGM
jgi:hypothetical protein